ELLANLSVSCNSTENNMIVYPNPNNGLFDLKINSGSTFKNTTLNILDITGKVVYSNQVNIMEGTNVLNLELSNVIGGSYIVVLPELSDKLIPVKFVIK